MISLSINLNWSTEMLRKIIPFRDNVKGPKKKAVADEHLILREYYNCNSSDLIFKVDERYVQYILHNKIPLGPNTFLLKAGQHKTVPHGYWVIETVDKRPTYELVTNFGDLIGKGNTKPSRPN